MATQKDQLPPEIATRRADEVRKLLHLPTVEVTCENCRDNGGCEFAFDLYNTSGDCLLEK